LTEHSEREKKIFDNIYAQFHYLLTLNEILLQHFLLISIINEADSVYKIKIIGMFDMLIFDGGCNGLLAVWHPLNAPLCVIASKSQLCSELLTYILYFT